MNDYPLIELKFLITLIENSKKVVDKITIGKTTSYIINGGRLLTDRMITLRELSDGNIDFECATGIATRLKCMPLLLEWLKENRSWKDGAYFEQKTKVNQN